jgi:hypothetical protein
MSVRIKITTKCDRCGKKSIEYSGSQCSGDPVSLPSGWSRTKEPFQSAVYRCDVCTAQLKELERINNLIIDNWRLGGLSSHSRRLYGTWAGWNAFMVEVEG